MSAKKNFNVHLKMSFVLILFALTFYSAYTNRNTHRIDAYSYTRYKTIRFVTDK